jgi:predicted dehydrogenase
MAKYKAVIIGAGRMAGTIDDEVVDYPCCIRPYSHAAGYAAVPEIEVTAFADTNAERVQQLQARYGVAGGYADWREMIERERPDFVSICTPGTTHAEMTIFAAEHGVKAIYCEKALACSLAEGDAMIEAVERNGTKFNMGTLRRWHPAANKAKELIDRGEIGTINTVIGFTTWSLLHSASHYFDLLLYFANDEPLDWVQGFITNTDFDPAAARTETELSGLCTVRFSNGVFAHSLCTSYVAEFEIAGSEGAIRSTNNGLQWHLRKQEKPEGSHYNEFNLRQFPHWPEQSPTVRLIRDLLQAVETDGETQQGIRKAAMTGELAFAIIESHRQGGARVDVPIANRDYYMASH